MKHEELLARYSNSLPDGSRAPYTAQARDFLKWAGSRELWVDVPGANGVERVANADLIRKYLTHLKIKYSSGSIASKWAIIRRMYIVNKIEWPFHRGDAPQISELDVEAPSMAPEEIEMMIDIVLGIRESIELLPRPQHTAYLVMATVWGMRRAEMQQMTPDKIDTRMRDGYGTIFVETAKHGRQRYHLLPPYLVEPLTALDLTRRRSVDYVTKVFAELKIMCGFTGESAYDVGWHGIRRACVHALKDAGIEQTDRTQFFRWKTGSRDMDTRYATSRVVRMGQGQEQATVTLGTEDRSLDLKVYAVHPFLKMWEDRLVDNG